MHLMPWPAQLAAGAGRVPLAADGWRVEGAAPRRVAAAARRLRRHWRGVAGGPVGLPIRVACEPAAALPALGDDERYHLRVDAAGVYIDAPLEWGVLRAFATLAQLIEADAGGACLPAVEIDDAPRFPWRGLMVDVARHFISMKTLRRTLDAMAFHKLNVLHLHLSDDQAFRFGSRSHAELATAAEHYTQPELRALVRYAAARGIRVVPELDVPGHVASWLAVHPEWGLGDIPQGRSTRFGVHECCLNPAHEGAMRAVEALFGELAATFPDRHAHFGGDEVRLPNGASVARLQARFNERVTALLRRLGKVPMAWDEAASEGLGRDVTIQCWRGDAALTRIVDAGFDAVLSAPYYLDLGYPADAHYRFDPATGTGPSLADEPRFAHVGDGLRAVEWAWRAADAPLPAATRRGAVLGGEACMWTELVSDELLHGRVWSRLPAIAERLWSPLKVDADAAGGVSAAEVDDMVRRLAASQRQLARAGILDLAASRRTGLRRLGLVAGDIDALMPLINALEPVKWYARLLGPMALKRRAEGVGEAAAERPYNAATPLSRVIDVIPPESLPARALLSADEGELRAIADGWRSQREAFLRCREKTPAIVELDAASAALCELATSLERRLDGAEVAIPPAYTEPFGEYLLAAAHRLSERFA